MESKIFALQKKLNQCTEHSERLNHFMNAEIVLSDIKQYCRFSHETYSRNVIFKNEEYELIAICWAEGQHSDPHHHGESSCAMQVLEGELLETTFVEIRTELTLMKTSVLRTGSSIFLESPMVWHQVKNTSNSQAISIHLYSPPLSA